MSDPDINKLEVRLAVTEALQKKHEEEILSVKSDIASLRTDVDDKLGKLATKLDMIYATMLKLNSALVVIAIVAPFVLKKLFP